MRECGPECECSRRAFIGDAAAAALGVLAVGAGAGRALALAPSSADALRSAAAERSYPIPSADGASIDTGESVIVARIDGAVYAFSLACPHQNTALRWDPDRRGFHCPKHHSLFRGDGTLIDGRAKRSMDRFALRRDGANVVVDLDRLFQQDTDPGPWAAAVVRL